jgi:hypothetical protein
MVALCLQHHKEADSGAFTHDELRDFKTNGFLVRTGSGPSGHFNWKREQLILVAGGGLYIRCPVFLEVAKRPMVWLSSDDEGRQLLNLDVWDSSGAHIFSMRDNDWLIVGELDDLEAPPAARSLIVRAPSKGVRVSIEFSTTSLDRLEQQLTSREAESAEQLVTRYETELATFVEEGAPAGLIEAYRGMVEGARTGVSARVQEVIGWIRAGWSEPEFVRCDFQAQLPFPVPIHVTESKIVLPGNITISGGMTVDCGTAIGIA